MKEALELQQVDSWDMIIAFLQNIDESKLQDIHFDLNRELRQNTYDCYGRRKNNEIGKAFIELKFTINHDIEG